MHNFTALSHSILYFLGPYYVVGAPDRQLEEGKAILATVDELKGDHNDTIAL